MAAEFADWLFVHAAAAEALPELRGQQLELGVGKTAAALRLQAALLTRQQVSPVAGIFLFGVAGAFPARHREKSVLVSPGDVCLVGDDQFGDEGVATPQGFRDLQQMGLGTIGPWPAATAATAAAAQRLAVPVVRGVTVSTCSGTELRSQQLSQRSRADVESMEGAAVALVCASLQLPWVQLRAISNWTGDRDQGAWDLPTALAVLRAAMQRLLSPDPA